jgi:hypothetical protein
VQQHAASTARRLDGAERPRRFGVRQEPVIGFQGIRRPPGRVLLKQLPYQYLQPRVQVAAGLWCGQELCAIDGFQIHLPATDANREEFGSSGTSDGSGPFPQARAVLVTARAGRAMLGAAMDACSAGEQTLIARLVAGHPGIFAGRVFVVDRNFLGHELATAILDAGGHLVMRVKQGISVIVTAVRGQLVPRVIGEGDPVAGQVPGLVIPIRVRGPVVPAGQPPRLFWGNTV